MSNMAKKALAFVTFALVASGAAATTFPGQAPGGAGGTALFRGTSAGVEITNQARAEYTVGVSGTITELSNIEAFSVDEKIQVDVTTVDTNVNVETPDTDQIVSFRVTNIGNGSELFTLSPDAVIDETAFRAGSFFDPSNARVYVDDGSGICDASDIVGAALVTLSDDVSLLSGGEILICVVSDIPGGQIDGDEADVQLTATSTTTGAAAAAAGDTLTNGGDLDVNGAATDAVVIDAGAADFDFATYVVTAIDVAIVKSVFNVNDGFTATGGDYIPGAIVTYQLALTVTGTGTASGLIVLDDVIVGDNSLGAAGGVLYVGSSLEVGPTNTSTAGLADDGSVSVTVNGQTVSGSVTRVAAGGPGGEDIDRVSVTFGNVPGDFDPAAGIQPYVAVILFDVEIQ